MKKCEILIKYCNSSCPYFYFNYFDYENIWCGLLNKKIFDIGNDVPMLFGDCKRREIPAECPLQDFLKAVEL